MAEETEQPKDGTKKGGTKRMTKEEYDRLVKGVDDIFFGGVDEPEGGQKPKPEKPDDEPTKRDADAK